MSGISTAAGEEHRGRYLHLFTLSSFAFAQPLLDLLGRNAEFFVARRSGAAEILSLVVVLVALLPLPLVALTALARRLGPRLGAAVHGLGLGTLAALIALQICKRLALLDGVPWLVAGLALGSLFVWAYRRSAALRMVSTYLGLALVVVPAVFLLNPRILKILLSHQPSELHVSGARTPVVFLLLDELSLTALLDERRQIDAASYPHLAALAREATWFPHATTVSYVTEIAVPAILTGKLPADGQLPILEDHPHNLFTALGGDYKLWVTEPFTRLCPPALNTAAGGSRTTAVSRLATLYSDLWIVFQHLLLPPRFSGGLPVISDRWRDFATVSRPDADVAPGGEAAARPDKDHFFAAALRALRRDRQEDLRRFVAAFDRDEPQALYFLHVLLPHTPWSYLPSGKSYWPDHVPGLKAERWADEEAVVKQAYQRYLLQVRFVDMWLGRIVERLRQLDLYDRSLIVFTSDHGVSFRPGDARRAATETNYADLIPVPLVIKAPHQRQGQVVEGHVSTLDVVPSILDLLDVAPPWPAPDGHSVFDPARPPASRRVIGKSRSFTFDDSLHRDKYATLDWKLASFGADPVRAGTHPELFGRQVDEVGWREQSTVTLRFTGANLFRQHEVHSPAFVTGTLETAAADVACCDLAVAVNGTLYATVRAFGTPPADLEFAALLPDEAFGASANQVEVFRIRRGGGQPVLERLAASRGEAYALVENDRQQVVAIEHDGRAIPVVKNALRGYFSTTTRRGTATVSGWAADLEAGAEPERILLFHRGELVLSGVNSKVRAAVNAQLGLPPTTRSAFELRVPLTRLPDLTRSGLRLFALSADAASELRFFYRLVKGADGGVAKIVANNGREIPVAPGALAGRVEKVSRQGDRLVLKGWAADVVHREPPERMLVFGRGKLIYDSYSFARRQDVAARYAMPEILRSGFRLRVAVGSGERLPASELLLFAVSRQGQAVYLPLEPGALGDGSTGLRGGRESDSPLSFGRSRRARRPGV